MLSYEKCWSLARIWADTQEDQATLVEELEKLECVYDNSYTEDIKQALQESRDR